MQKISVYEQLGIVIPGCVLVFGLSLLFPNLQFLTAKDGVSVGELGLFVLISYAAGHLVAAIANALESFLWGLAGGMPSGWITRTPPELLDAKQIERVRAKAAERFNVQLEDAGNTTAKFWWPISRQIYADVAKNGKPDRVDTFNGNYGLNRGLAAACVALASVAVFLHLYLAAVGLGVAGAVYAYRAYRFAVHYVRELYLQFLII